MKTLDMPRTERVPLLKRLEDRTRELKAQVEAAQRTRHLIQEQLTLLRMGGSEAEALAALKRQGITP